MQKSKVKTIALGALLFAASTGYAQEAPTAGTIQASVLLGKSAFSSGTVALSSLNTEYYLNPTGTVDAGGLTNSIISFSANENSLVNMVGAEIKYFVTDQIAVSFLGAGAYSLNPGKDYEQGVPAEGIPNNANFEARFNTRLVGVIGGDYYFPVSNARVQPYAGVRFALQYASITTTATLDATTATGGTPPVDYGARSGQIFGWSPSLAAGIEYVLSPGLHLGFEIQPVGYSYSGVSLYAAPGVSPATGVAQEVLFLSQPKLKIGFRF
ncbi:hypothetical protein AGMMS49982_20050 [Bacteroidia bacterium]|nr:hypothetical protein AGMMS49982_20050 [Bacteroidia bacterium]